MLKVFLCAGAVAASAVDAERSLLSTRSVGSVRYDVGSHIPRVSSGCGKSLPSGYKAGSTTVFTGKYAGTTRTWRVYVPSGYSSSTAHPVVISHHGWNGNAAGQEKADGMKSQAAANNFIAVWPQGMADCSSAGGSWNCVGSTQSPWPDGATCTKSAGTQNYCYTSCGKCTDNPQCWWTTCDDDVTSTGVGTDVDGFIPGLYDTLEADLCVDTTREFAMGYSNGGMMTYQLGASLSSRLAAIVPIAGSFHNGFLQAPTVGVPVMDVHGTRDTTVPANTTNGGGWYYTITSQIFNGNAYSSGWKQANGCSGSSSHYATTLDGVSSLYCISEGSCSGGDVVRCIWNGGHTMFASSASKNGQLTWEFMSRWTKTSHLGGGCTAGEPCSGRPLAIRMATGNESSARDITARTSTSPLSLSTVGHYGDPDAGCLEDEDTLPLAGGRVCAPRIAFTETTDEELAPQCKFGDGPFKIPNNGCPLDVVAETAAWPACVAKGNTTDPYGNGEFHCVLMCGPCSDPDSESAECEEAAHQMCPGSSKCVRGEVRPVNFGVCTYHSVADQGTSLAI